MATSARTFFLSGAYSSVVVSAALGVDEPDPMIAMEHQGLWGEDFVQLRPNTVFLSLGTDAIGQPVTIYVHQGAVPLDLSAERTLTATFVSRGERIFLEYIDNMTFASEGLSFGLPAGRYRVDILSWNIEISYDNPANELTPDNVRHELHFTLL